MHVIHPCRVYRSLVVYYLGEYTNFFALIMTVITVAIACDVWHCTFPRCSGDSVMTQRIFMLPVDASPVCSD